MARCSQFLEQYDQNMEMAILSFLQLQPSLREGLVFTVSSLPGHGPQSDSPVCKKERATLGKVAACPLMRGAH